MGIPGRLQRPGRLALRVRRAPLRTPDVAVLGAGHGGQGVAAILMERGLPVTLYNRSDARLAEVRAAGGLTLLPSGGRWSGRPVAPKRLTSDLAVAAEAEILLLAVPASAHRELAAGLAPHLRSGQTVILHPGRTLGAVEFRHELAARGCRARIVIGETDTLLCAARREGPGSVRVYAVKHEVRLATLPADAARGVVARLAAFLPEWVPARSVLETSLGNVGAILHPGPALLNLARIETGEAFDYYRDGISPAVASVLQTLDAERLAVAAAYGVEVPSLREWLVRTYGAWGKALHAAVAATAAYRGIRAPTGLPCRYLYEDVPTGLVPLAELGAAAGVPTPTADALIAIASAACGVAFRDRGRSLANLDLAGCTPAALRRRLTEGELAHAQV